MTSRPKYNQYLTSNRRQVPAGIVYGRGAPCGDFCRHIFSESQTISYKMPLVSTLECWGFIVPERVTYVTDV